MTYNTRYENENHSSTLVKIGNYHIEEVVSYSWLGIDYILFTYIIHNIYNRSVFIAADRSPEERIKRKEPIAEAKRSKITVKSTFVWEVVEEKTDKINQQIFSDRCGTFSKQRTT
jgi:hypothetical protein